MDENEDKSHKKTVGAKKTVGSGGKIGLVATDDKFDKGQKKITGAKMIGFPEKGSKKVAEIGAGRKIAFMADAAKNKGKDKDKDKSSKGKDKDKDKLKKGKKNPKWGKSSKISRSIRAGVTFPVSRIHRFMKPYAGAKMKVSGTAGIFTAAVVEYLAAEVLELAGNECKERKKKLIRPRHLTFAIKRDEELDSLIKATIRGGGVVPTANRAVPSQQQEAPKEHSEAGTPGEF